MEHHSFIKIFEMKPHSFAFISAFLCHSEYLITDAGSTILIT